MRNRPLCGQEKTKPNKANFSTPKGVKKNTEFGIQNTEGRRNGLGEIDG